jgi:hypothetical protein
MLSFLSNLVRGFRTAKTARPARRTQRHANLRLEGLEERMVPTGISTIGTTLNVNCTQGRIITFQQASPTVFSISDNVQGQVAQVNRSFFKNVNIIVQGQDTIDVNDSNGMPFLLGTAITAEGFGTNNALDLFGNRAIATGATYTVANTTATNSTLVEDNLTFTMTRAITSVDDVLQDTGGPLVVNTSSNDVILTTTGIEQELLNLGSGGGGKLTFAGKSQVVLNENAAFTQTFLEARTAAAGEQIFTLQMNAQNDSASVFATPGSIPTVVRANGNGEIVNVQAATGILNILGSSSTTDVNLAGAGIQGFVSVNGVADLVVTNTGTAAQNVTVTQDAIFGTGLFGTSTAEVIYQNARVLAINAGSGSDHYTVNALNGPFATKLEIEDTAHTTSFVDDVFVNSLSELNMQVVNLANPAIAELIVHHHLGKAGISRVSPTSTNGLVTVSYPGELPSEVTFDGFGVVKTASF